MDWQILTMLAGGTAILAGTARFRRSRQAAVASAAGLEPIGDLSHLPQALQRTALWALGEGGFERSVVHGVVARAGADVAITAFDFETHRERRGEWAYLPVEPAFRIGGVVSVVVCELDRVFPHILLKRAGRGDKLLDDHWTERGSVTKQVRDRLGLGRLVPAELPATLPPAPLAVELPEHWRAYGQTIDGVIATEGFHAALVQAGRRDLVIELIDSLVVIYPAARDVAGADPFADLIESALVFVDGIRGITVTPRGIESQR